jgi:peptidoglycan/LPS O-acetylase OafA/YrhL
MRVDVLSGSEGDDATIRYRADIDGLRAIAIASVVLYHAQFPITGGFVGVDIFFVISGYLITSGILNHRTTARFDYWIFTSDVRDESFRLCW